MKPKANFTEDSMEIGGNTWSERRDWHPLDRVLRENRFVIHSRDGNEEALWRKDNLVYTEDEALSLCPKKDVARARGEGRY